MGVDHKIEQLIVPVQIKREARLQDDGAFHTPHGAGTPEIKGLDELPDTDRAYEIGLVVDTILR